MDENLNIYACDKCVHNCHVIINKQDYAPVNCPCLSTYMHEANFHKLENISFMICDNRDLKNTKDNDTNLITAEEARKRTESGINNILNKIFIDIKNESDQGNFNFKCSYLNDLPTNLQIQVIRKLRKLGYLTYHYHIGDNSKDFYIIDWNKNESN